SRLVEDLLLLSRLESQETALSEEEVDVAQLVRELGDEARALSSGRHAISVDVAPIGVRGSREELRSAFSNMVTNAIRYTPAGGRIWVRWRADAGRGGVGVA